MTICHCKTTFVGQWVYEAKPKTRRHFSSGGTTNNKKSAVSLQYNPCIMRTCQKQGALNYKEILDYQPGWTLCVKVGQDRCYVAECTRHANT